MILSLKRLGSERKILVNTDHCASIEEEAKGCKITYANVESPENEIAVSTPIEDIICLFKGKKIEKVEKVDDPKKTDETEKNDQGDAGE